MAKVLVVDDDPDFVKVTKKVLEKAGHNVVSAANGAKALEAMRQSPPDVVLLDIMMSYILDGLDVSREMAEDPTLKDIPVIMSICHYWMPNCIENEIGWNSVYIRCSARCPCWRKVWRYLPKR